MSEWIDRSKIEDWQVPWIRLKWRWRKIRRTLWSIQQLRLDIREMKARLKADAHRLKNTWSR